MLAGPGAGGENTPTVSDLLAQYQPPAGHGEPYDGGSDKIALGQQLFFDPLLSRGGNQSCATCHNPGLSWGDGLPRAVGDDGRVMGRRAPTILNIDQLGRLGWDGRFSDIEAVTFAAITSPANMNLPEAEALDRIRRNPSYASRFSQLYPGRDVSRSTVEDAIAAYERTIVSGQAAFDRWVAGDTGAISPEAQAGFLLFNGKGRCASCHSGWAFTDGSFHDIGTATGDDIGRGALFPSSRKLRYAFKTPTLRDVARRAPYMHDGTVPDLASVIDLYDRGGIDRPSRSELIRPLELTEREKAELIAFLQTLTEPAKPLLVPVLPR